MIRFSDLPSITGGTIVALSEDDDVEFLLTDSRKASAGKGGVFFAIQGKHHDSHALLGELAARGIRQFIVEKLPANVPTGCNVLQVQSSVHALQEIVAYHRQSFSIPVIGITGSNGKTIIKEWLFQLLSPDYRVIKNPGSYNSQIGVPLSVWQMAAHHQLGLFEAGISQPGEMEKLERMIHPSIGIFTNIGSAHDEGFESREQKAEEKSKLFASSDLVIYCKDHEIIDRVMNGKTVRKLTWGKHEHADVKVEQIDSVWRLSQEEKQFTLELPFRDPASVENCMHAVVLMLHFGYSPAVIQNRINGIKSVGMRLEVKQGINNCVIIDDSYNNDFGGLQISLDFLNHQHQRKKKSLIISEFLETGLSDEMIAGQVNSMISKLPLEQIIAIGPGLRHLQPHSVRVHHFETTQSFLDSFDRGLLQDELILIKGARRHQFEKIVNAFQLKVHGTVMEISLGNIVHNLNYFRGLLKPTTKIMAMVKAFAYGSGSVEIANLLQYHKVDYLGVAYADEGAQLRQNNITLPIMVMNPSPESFDTLVRHQLEPEIYNFRILKSYLEYLNGRRGVIHLKLDTGMHRLGFEPRDVSHLITILVANPHIQVATMFSHLAGADEADHDAFSKFQADQFQSMADSISHAIGYKPFYHLLNSPGILRLPSFQFDMVRLGIGLYGVDPAQSGAGEKLKPVAKLKTIISQIKHIPKGETIGYGRKGKAVHDMTLATIAIGYADGFSRAFSRGVGEVLIGNKRAPVVGNVCMDMTMVDITGIPAQEGDEVVVFGDGLPLEELAQKIHTIPYEILTNTSERVKRVFAAESI